MDKHHSLMVQRYDHLRMIEVVTKQIYKGSAALRVIHELMRRIETNGRGDVNTGNMINSQCSSRSISTAYCSTAISSVPTKSVS